MKWQNVGSAPCYEPYRLAYRLTGTNKWRKVFVGKVTVRRWMPGSVELFTKKFFQADWDLPPGSAVNETDGIALPMDMPPGVYTLSLAVVPKDSASPALRLGIQGRADDGWYPLSKLNVSK